MAVDTLPAGHVVGGKYRVERLIGRGGYGAVYRAAQIGSDRRVALKVLAHALVAEPTAMQRFGREADLVQHFSHPNAVTLFDHGCGEDELPYIAFELLRGQPLDALLRRGPLPVPRVARIAAQALRALAAAHALGIVHRDIKPSNLFVCDYPGQPDFVKVLDFGIAKVPVDNGDTTLGLTREGQILGTPNYMAPEQVRLENVGPSADLYAMGLLISEAIAGKRVFSGGSGFEICMLQAAAAPAPHAAAVLGSALGGVVAKATEKKASRRYASAAAMLADLEAAMPEARPGFVGSAAAAEPETAAIVGPLTVAASPVGGFGRALHQPVFSAGPPPATTRRSGPRTRTLTAIVAGVVAVAAVATAALAVDWNRDDEEATEEPAITAGAQPVPVATATPTLTADPVDPGPTDPLEPSAAPTAQPAPTAAQPFAPTPAPTPTPAPRPTLPPPQSVPTVPTCGCAPSDIACVVRCNQGSRF